MRPIRDGIGTLTEGDVQQFDRLLSSFVAEARAFCAVLVDRSGRQITKAGNTAALDAATFASLVAGDFAASDQLARILGEEEFSSLYHAGEGNSMFLTDVHGWGILAALFDGKTTLGMVRLRCKLVVPKLAAVFAQIATRPKQSALSLGMDNNWLNEAEDEIDRLFGAD